MRPLALAAMVLASAAAGDAAPGGSASLRGGTYRVGWEAVFGWSTADMDPTGEADPRSMGIFSNLLLRTLVQYRHVS